MTLFRITLFNPTNKLIPYIQRIVTLIIVNRTFKLPENVLLSATPQKTQEKKHLTPSDDSTVPCTPHCSGLGGPCLTGKHYGPLAGVECFLYWYRNPSVTIDVFASVKKFLRVNTSQVKGADSRISKTYRR